MRIKINGVEKTLGEWSVFFGVPYRTAYRRFYKGYPLELVFTRTCLSHKTRDRERMKDPLYLKSLVDIRLVDAKGDLP